MTEQMAIEELKGLIEDDHRIYAEEYEALEVAIQALEEIQKYRAIEKKLEDMFGGKVPIRMVVDLLEQYMLEPDNPLKMNARILTYEQSAEWDKYMMAKTKLEELSGHGVDVTKLIHYFCETIFECEQHQGFCILTNEEAKEWEELKAIGTVEEWQSAIKEEDVLKFYYIESEDRYVVGRRVDNFYYGEVGKTGLVFYMSRYLPWGEHVVDPTSAWKEHTYPSEPKEIPFFDWLQGFIKKECGGTIEELQALKEKEERFDRNITMFNEIGLEIRNKAIEEFAEKLIAHFNDWCCQEAPCNDDETDRTRHIICETICDAIGGVNEIAESMKGEK